MDSNILSTSTVVLLLVLIVLNIYNAYKLHLLDEPFEKPINSQHHMNNAMQQHAMPYHIGMKRDNDMMPPHGMPQQSMPPHGMPYHIGMKRDNEMPQQSMPYHIGVHNMMPQQQSGMKRDNNDMMPPHGMPYQQSGMKRDNNDMIQQQSMPPHGMPKGLMSPQDAYARFR